MPGTLAIDAQNTFTAALLLSAIRKTKYQSDEPDVTRDGQPKWAVECAVTYHAENGMKPVSEVISVGTIGADPAAGIAPGSPIEFQRLRVGFSAPEAQHQENGRGIRVKGGRPWFQCDTIRPVHVQRQPVKAEA